MQILSQEVEEQLTKAIVALVEQTMSKEEQRRSESQRYLRASEAAAYCSVSKQTLTSWVYKHNLPQIKIDQVVCYDRKDLDQFMITSKILGRV